MPLYAVVGIDHPPHSMALRDRVRPEHRAYVKGNDRLLRLAAVMLDPAGNQQGTLLIFEADSLETVRAWAQQEPFCRSGVYRDLHIAEIRVAMNRIGLSDWYV